jgi:hypothetical protein
MPVRAFALAVVTDDPTDGEGMGSFSETFGERLVNDVITEAFDEITGRSNRKWAAIVVAVVAGAVIAAAITRRRGRGGKVVIASGSDGTT